MKVDRGVEGEGAKEGGGVGIPLIHG